jgi:multimeric flavodoxin WrbA
MTKEQEQITPATKDSYDYSGLKAVLVNTSLKKEASQSHTRLLMDVVANIMKKHGVEVDHVHLLDYDVPPGVYPDMREHGWETDAWPSVWDKIQQAEILVVGTPLWLGEESSVCRVLIERLYGMSGMLNDLGQSIYYNKVGGCVITGNEDGIKHTAMTISYALSHLGYTIPPQADCGWIGEAGPGPSYGDRLEDGTYAGFDNDFTQRNTTIMTWNLMHLARMIKDAGGIPNHGNNRELWKSGCRFDHQNPEYRS